MRVGRIPYINCYPVYHAIDQGIVSLDGELINGVPSQLNRLMSQSGLDVSVVSAVEYARDSERYYLLPDLAISCDGPVRSVLLLSQLPASELGGRTVLVSRSSMTSVALLELLFRHVWNCEPNFIPGDAEVSDIASFSSTRHDARLVIGDAALLMRGDTGLEVAPQYSYSYDLGLEWKKWTGLPFVFAVWVALKSAPVADSLRVHASLVMSRDWGVNNHSVLAAAAESASGVPADFCREYFAGLDYRLSYPHLAGLTDFFRRLETVGKVPAAGLSFLPAA